MKQLKLCLTAAATAFSLAAFAQTESDPAVLVAGENSYDGDLNYTYWSYTPAQDELVTITGIYANSVTVEGKVTASYSNQNQYAGELSTVFAAEAGKTVLMEVYRGWYDPSEYTFTASFEPCEYNDGQDCSDPIAMTKPHTFIPTIGTTGGWMTPATYKPVYLQYASDVDGMLDMTFSSMPDGLAWAEKAESPCDSEFVEFSSDDLDSRMHLEIEADKTYVFRIEGTDAMFATFESRVPVMGASCDDAWTVAPGQNQVPAEAGTYWYKVNVAEAGYLTLTSEADGSVSLYSKCNSSYPSSCDAIAVRVYVDAQSSRVFSITKEATDAPIEFNLAIDPAQPYDKMSTAEVINADDTYRTPGFGGEYYYKVIAPETGAWFLNLSIDSEAEGLSCAIYEYDQNWGSWQHVTSGYGSARCEVANGMAYMVKLTMPNDARNVPFAVSFTEVEPGQTASNPLELTKGINGLPAQPATYFTFTPTESAWLAVSVPEGVDVPSVTLRNDKYSSPTAGSMAAAEGYASARRWQVSEGVEYMVEFGKVSEASDFLVEMIDFQAGEALGSAIAVENGEAELPEAEGTSWYSYVATGNGFATVSTDLSYSIDNVYSSVMIYLNDKTGTNGVGLGSDYTGSGYVMGTRKISVSEGDVLYIRVQKPAEGGRHIFVVESVAQPGQTPATAIRVDLSEGPASIEAPVVGYNDDPVYYVIHLEEGIFSMANSSNCSMYMYAGIDKVNANEYMGYSSSYSLDGNYVYGFKKVSVTVPGDYYFKLSQNGSYGATAPTTMTFSMREPGLGESPATAQPIEVAEAGSADWNVASLDYGESMWYSIYLKPGELHGEIDNYFDAKFYSASDLAVPMARFVYDYDTYASELNVEIAEEGTYYFFVENNYYNITIQLTGSAVDVNTAVGVLAADASVKGGKGEIVANGNGMMGVYDLNGRAVATKAVNGSAAVSVAPGMYIVRFGDRSSKIIVK